MKMVVLYTIRVITWLIVALLLIFLEKKLFAGKRVVWLVIFVLALCANLLLLTNDDTLLYTLLEDATIVIIAISTVSFIQIWRRQKHA